MRGRPLQIVLVIGENGAEAARLLDMIGTLPDNVEVIVQTAPRVSPSRRLEMDDLIAKVNQIDITRCVTHEVMVDQDTGHHLVSEVVTEAQLGVDMSSISTILAKVSQEVKDPVKISLPASRKNSSDWFEKKRSNRRAKRRKR